MKKNNFTALHQIEQYYVERTLDNIKNKVKVRYQQWQDPLDNNVKVSTIESIERKVKRLQSLQYGRKS